MPQAVRTKFLSASKWSHSKSYMGSNLYTPVFTSYILRLLSNDLLKIINKDKDKDKVK